MLTVLFVCTGNVCRSPAAQLLLRRRALDRSGVVALSAGLAALDGHGVDTATATALRGLGVDPSGHRARSLEPAMLAAADLILTAERSHRDRIMALAPTQFRNTFTMREFARLSGDLAATSALAAVAEVSRRRGTADPGGEYDDLVDPYRDLGPIAHAVVSQIDECVRALARDLQGIDRPTIGRRRPQPAGRRAAPGPGPTAAPRAERGDPAVRAPRPRPR